MPSEFDPSLWDNPDIGRLLHHASQCLYHRDIDSARIALEAIPNNLQGDLRALHVGCLSWYYVQQAQVQQVLDMYEQERASIDLLTVCGAWAGYYVSQALITNAQQPEALDILAVVEATFRAQDEFIALGLTLGLVGGCLSDLGDVSTAIQYFLYSIEVLLEHGTVRQHIRSAMNAAYAYMQVSRFQDAFDFSMRLLQNHQDQLEPPELSSLYGLLQRSSEYHGDFEESSKWLALNEKLAHEHQVDFLIRNLTIDRGVILTHVGQYAEAYALLSTINVDDATDLTGDLLVRYDFSMGLCLQHLGRKADARSWYARLTTRITRQGVSFYVLTSVLKRVNEITKHDPELSDPSINDSYLRLLEARIADFDKGSSRVMNFHARYAARLAQYQRERDEQLHTTLLDAGEEARRDIATAIHDGAGQELAVLGMQLDMALHDLPTEHPSRQYVAQARERVSLTARQLRTLSHTLGTHSLERDGLPSALYNMAGDIRSTSRMTVACDVDEHLATIPVDLARSIYRTVQTLTSNVLQHAYASTLTINVQATLNAITVRVSDDGVGIDMSRSTEGMGWRSIHARVALRGGTFSVTSAPGAGTTAIATFGYSAS